MTQDLSLGREPPRRHSGVRLAVWLAVIGVLLTIAWMALTVGNPLPARTLAMATGPEGSGNAALGLRYREVLRRSGIDLTLVPTPGGFANVERLSDPESDVTVALVEGGVTNHEASPQLVSLGGVALEPLWVFVRDERPGTLADRLDGKRVSIEQEGSATRVLFRKLLELNAIPETSLHLRALSPDAGAEALLHGESDAAVMLTSWPSPAVRRLLGANGIALQGFPRADAYVALFPNFSKVVLPTGAGDLAANVPASDVPLLAVELNLIVRRSLHPALQYVLLEAAAEIHGRADVFSRAGRFPAPGTIDLPLSKQARTFYRSGEPFVYPYLPFWAAALVERLLIILIPLFAIVFPIANIGPRVYSYLNERRIFLFYRELQAVERLLETSRPEADTDALVAALDDLDRRANHLKLPLAYSQRLFFLKSHIALARTEVARRRQSIVADAG